MNKKHTVIELFAGAGGLALGLKQAGFSTLGLVEIDKDSANTLRNNNKNWNVIHEDIVEFAQKDLLKEFNLKEGELDLLSGGYPCQAFSYAGQKRGLEDVRGTLFYQYALFLNKLKPKMFLAENVKGLVTHDNGKTLKTMIEVFENEGYEVKYKVLNAWNYGVAQKRERIFIIGIRKDLVENIEFNFPQEHSYKPVLRDVLVDVPDSVGVEYSENKKKVMELVPPGGCWVNLPEQVAKDYMKTTYYMGGGRRGIARRLSYDEPSLTLTTSPSMKQTERCHPEQTRPLKTREYARIQSFPDEWQFSGSVASIYKQIGNAVPVNLAKEVGKEVIKVLEKIKKIRSL
ncbi:DNA cytosine methyltransferase [Mycoplasma procyoni]|uniref:DNA cytosine methyltransferase n=1 Tax=Mycoplasma procyoni TaxID=568784 RepID=UPI00197B1E56|nr:DNA cytosine methyltransferase [Mycoplasma procyoni]MBN3534765.1 DNA cytosine methyltransferase [Mycoplasma procyoni]